MASDSADKEFESIFQDQLASLNGNEEQEFEEVYQNAAVENENTPEDAVQVEISFEQLYEELISEQSEKADNGNGNDSQDSTNDENVSSTEEDEDAGRHDSKDK